MNKKIPCKYCEKEVRPAKGYLGGGVVCNDCVERRKQENML